MHLVVNILSIKIRLSTIISAILVNHWHFAALKRWPLNKSLCSPVSKQQNLAVFMFPDPKIIPHPWEGIINMVENLSTYRSIDDPKVSKISFIPQIFSTVCQINIVIMSRTSVFTNMQALLANLLGSRLYSDQYI